MFNVLCIKIKYLILFRIIDAGETKSEWWNDFTISPITNRLGVTGVTGELV